MQEKIAKKIEKMYFFRMGKFDDRLIKVIFTYGDTQVEIDGTQANIYARGMRYADATQNECAVTISNLRRETRDRLATQLTPFNYDQARKSVKIFAGYDLAQAYLI